MATRCLQGCNSLWGFWDSDDTINHARQSAGCLQSSAEALRVIYNHGLTLWLSNLLSFYCRHCTEKLLL